MVLTDIRMPPTETDEGIRAAMILRETHPQTGVVVLSQYGHPSYALALLENGSDRRAYLLKQRVHERDELVRAITSVAEGGSVIDPKIVEELVAAKARAESSPLADLTPREGEVLAEIAQGKSNTAIAESLVLTKRAVEKHINSIFLKLNLSEAEDVSKRVKAALVFLTAASSPPPVGISPASSDVPGWSVRLDRTARALERSRGESQPRSTRQWPPAMGTGSSSTRCPAGSFLTSGCRRRTRCG